MGAASPLDMRRFRIVSLLVVTLVVAASAENVALAQYARKRITDVPTASPTVEADSGVHQHRWYGWQLLGSDAAALALFTAGASADNSGGVAVVGIGTYAFGAPILHFANGHPGRGVTSFGLRVGVPLVLGAIVRGASTKENCEATEDPVCNLGYDVAPIAYGLLGAAAVMLVDDLFLSHDEVVRKQPAWTPAVAPSNGGMTLGLAGTF